MLPTCRKVILKKSLIADFLGPAGYLAERKQLLPFSIQKGNSSFHTNIFYY